MLHQIDVICIKYIAISRCCSMLTVRLYDDAYGRKEVKIADILRTYFVNGPFLAVGNKSYAENMYPWHRYGGEAVGAGNITL